MPYMLVYTGTPCAFTRFSISLHAFLYIAIAAFVNSLSVINKFYTFRSLFRDLLLKYHTEGIPLLAVFPYWDMSHLNPSELDEFSGDFLSWRIFKRV